MPTVPADKEPALKITSEFLEDASLYERKTGSMTNNFQHYSKAPSITGYCPTCSDDRTFVFRYVRTPWGSVSKYESQSQDLRNTIIEYHYACGGCHTFETVFFIRFADDLKSIQKVGQFPKLDISIDPETRTKLGAHVDTYQKARICEAHGYGIGAFAYYRRIVELLIDGLMDEVGVLVEEAQKDAYRKALQEIRDSHRKSDKIDFIKPLIPGALKPGNSNPVGLLYGAISEGLHNESDEVCLKKAKAIRKVLENFIHLLNANKLAADEFKAGMAELLSPAQQSD